MKVGLDTGPVAGLLKPRDDPMSLVDVAVEYGFDGVMLAARALTRDEAALDSVIDRTRECGLYLELGGAGIDLARSGRSLRELVEAWEPLFPLAVKTGSRVLMTGLGTWPWEGRVVLEGGRTLEDQIQGAITTLRALAPMAKEHGVAVVIHTSHFTAAEYRRIVDEVDSPYVGLCLDTGNAFLVLEDPLEFAREVAPFVQATHFKDTCVYLQDDGMDWLGGCVLGRGVLDLPAIAEILYTANPEINLTIEDHWGRMTLPIYDPSFLNTLGPWDGGRTAVLARYLWEGERLLRAGLHPTAAEAKDVDWGKVFPERQRSNAAYAKRLIEEITRGGGETADG
jgi:sugar phosphate isomerase/epimerase